MNAINANTAEQRDISNGSLHWWQTTIIYQVYPRSFRDANGDGVGDVAGIRQGLDYLESLHVGCLWLSPVYPSPMRDFGYDVSNYTDIDPLFGTLDDFDALLAEVHLRGMKLIMDLVPNHTSIEHPWFVDSRSSHESSRRDWYIWRDPAAGGGPPNNWLSFFGGPAWTFDPFSDQYYLHQFDSSQPELNYRHPDVLPAMLDCVRFWLERGVDGFRVDVIWLLMKDLALRDEPLNADWTGINPHEQLLHLYSANQPDVHPLIRAMRLLFDRFGERVMIGEIDLPPAELMAYYGDNLNECHLPFNFSLIHTPWVAGRILEAIKEYERLLPTGGWPNWVLGNHDRPRLATRIGKAQARVAQLLLLTLRGTPTCYYGDELGMENGEVPPEQVRDPQAINQPELAGLMGRDPQRTPLAWDNSANNGFTSSEAVPWLPMSSDADRVNIMAEAADSLSDLNFFRAATRLRQSTPALMAGDFQAISQSNENVIAYTRSWEGESLLVVLNLGCECEIWPGILDSEADILLSTHMTRRGVTSLRPLYLAADEGLVLRIQTVGAHSRSMS